MERSCGAVIFRKNKYLLLHYEEGHWDFVKGHKEKGETEEETVRRETEEETGITDLKIIPGFRETITYFFRRHGKLIKKKVIFFLAETKTKNVKLSFEHVGFAWLEYKDALERLTYKNSKEILKKAHEFRLSSLRRLMS